METKLLYNLGYCPYTSPLTRLKEQPNLGKRRPNGRPEGIKPFQISENSVKKTIPLLTAFFFSIAGLMVLYFTVAGSHGLLHLQKINNELALLDQKNRELESEILDLENKVYGIKTSRFELEKSVRQELGYARPGEIVYITPQSGRPAPPQPNR